MKFDLDKDAEIEMRKEKNEEDEEDGDDNLIYESATVEETFGSSAITAGGESGSSIIVLWNLKA
jgi:hypothetical protein